MSVTIKGKKCRNIAEQVAWNDYRISKLVGDGIEECIHKTDNSCDVWAMASVITGGKYYALPFHIGPTGIVYLSNTTSNALSLSGAELQITFFTS